MPAGVVALERTHAKGGTPLPCPEGRLQVGGLTSWNSLSCIGAGGSVQVVSGLGRGQSPGAGTPQRSGTWGARCVLLPASEARAPLLPLREVTAQGGCLLRAPSRAVPELRWRQTHFSGRAETG